MKVGKQKLDVRKIWKKIEMGGKEGERECVYILCSGGGGGAGAGDGGDDDDDRVEQKVVSFIL